MRSAVLAALFAGLSGIACAQTGILQSPSAAPGTSLIAPAAAGSMFALACIQTRPQFEGAAMALSSEPVMQSSTTGTVFHQVFNLSFNADRERCSMVFAYSGSIDSVIDGLARGTASVVPPAQVPRTIDVSSFEGPDGLRYVRMALPEG